MATEYRALKSDDEYRAYARIAEYSFNGNPRDDERIGRRESWYEREWMLGGFDGDSLVSGLGIIPFEMYINGAAIPLGGIASVASAPEQRRSGAVGGLLSHSLAVMREAGQPLSALYTPHYSLYRRFGWEQASRLLSYAFPPKVVQTRMAPPAGAYRRTEDWRELEPLYTARWASTNGALVRPERWWQTMIMSTWKGEPRDAVIWTDASGEARAYAVYNTSHQAVAGSPWGETTLRVHDWVALDAAGYTALLAYLTTHDLADRIIMLTSTEEPLPAAFVEPTYFTQPTGAWFGIMLRLVDVQRAIEARPALPQASGKGVAIALTDEKAPWNAGTWRIEAREGRMSAERTTSAPGLEMDVRALAPIYNGFLKPADAVRVGVARTASEDAIANATDIFAVSHATYTPDDF